MKVSQLMAATGFAAAILVAGGGAAWAAPAPDGGATSCAEGSITTIVDVNGVQQQACVASAVEAPVAPAQASSLTAPAAVPVAVPHSTESAGSQATLPATGAGTGGLLIAALLVGSGSVVSLISRRKPLGRSKGFRRRRATP